MTRALLAAVAAVVAVAFGVGTYLWLVPDLQLAFVLALTYGLAVYLYGRWGKFLRGASGQWQSNRWRIGGTSFMLIVAVFALGPSVPVAGDVRLAVQLLVLGAVWVGMMLGVASVGDQPGVVAEAEHVEREGSEGA